jgi:DNA-directed RNA polymerase I, II, and III subunit RPABC2
MSFEKQLFPKLKHLGEELIEDVVDETQKLKSKAEDAVAAAKEGITSMEEKLKSNPISDFFSKLVPNNELDANAVTEDAVAVASDDEDAVADEVDEDADEDAVDEDAVADAVDDDAVDEDAVDEDVDAEDVVDDDDAEQETKKPISQVIEHTLGINAESSDEDTDSDDDENYLQKFDADVKKNYLLDFHPEAQTHNYEEVKKFSTVKRNKQGDVIDLLHRTIPILTKYERTRILGQRAKQLNSGAQSTVQIPDSTIDGYLMALEELRQRKIPFIIRRPIPNGGFEYWKVSDLEFLE